MSPREALRRLTFFVPAGSPRASLNVASIATCQTRLASVAADIESITREETPPLPLHGTHQARAPRWFIVTDSLALCAGYLTAWLLASATTGLFFDVTPFLSFALISAGCLAWFAVANHYKGRRPFWQETKKIIQIMGFGLILDGFSRLLAQQEPSRLFLVSAWLFATVFLLAGRTLARAFLRRKGLWGVRTLLVGSGKTADATRAALRSESSLGYDVVMQIDNLPLVFSQAGNSWHTLRARFQAEHVVLALNGKTLSEAAYALSRLIEEDVPFSIVPPAYPLLSATMQAQNFLNHDVVMLTRESGLDRPFARFFKRSLDIAGACAGLLFFAPILLPLIFLVRRDGGPAFYGDARLGLNGKLFSCLKFRSMVLNCEEVLTRYLRENPDAAAEWKLYYKLRGHDPRLTKVGVFIRRWSLDEIPQLLNVLKGDMSLVGPRPIRDVEAPDYAGLATYIKVRPGLTGLWQVSGRANATFAARAQMDDLYVRNWSLWQDVAILAKTFPAVLKGTGAR